MDFIKNYNIASEAKEYPFGENEIAYLLFLKNSKHSKCVHTYGKYNFPACYFRAIASTASVATLTIFYLGIFPNPLLKFEVLYTENTK